MAEKWSKEKRSEVMRKIGAKDTKPELMLRKALFAKGYRYLVHNKHLPGKPDLVFPMYRTVIFVHGCFWHFHKDCREGRVPNTNSQYWKSKLAGNIERDLRNQKLLRQQGWQVIIAWECDIEKRLHSTLETIEQCFKETLGPSSSHD